MSNGFSEASAPPPKVSVIIPASNEARTIARVIAEAGKVHPRTEVIVVVNGSTDGTAELAFRKGARVLRYAERLGHDVGRSVGARAARGDIVLFTDGDLVIAAEQLYPFVAAIERGADIALNQYQGRVQTDRAHPVIVSKRTLNALLRRPDLGTSSMTTVPHAMSRRALERIGCDALAVPPKAQAMALAGGLRVEQAGLVEVGKMNPKRRKAPDPVGPLVVGDHLEALHWLLVQNSARASLTDLGRRREKVRDWR